MRNVSLNYPLLRWLSRAFSKHLSCRNSCVPSISGVSVEGQGAKSPFLPGALQIRGNWLGCLERERPENQGSSEVFLLRFSCFFFSVFLKTMGFNTKF